MTEQDRTEEQRYLTTTRHFMDSETELIKRAQAGDQDALNQLADIQLAKESGLQDAMTRYFARVCRPMGGGL